MKRSSQIPLTLLNMEIGEVAQLWLKHPNSVRRAIDDGRLMARKMRSGRWLIYTPSALALWGEPFARIDTLL